MRRMFVAIIGMMVLLGTAYAQPFQGHRHGMHGGGILQGIIELGLSDAQKHEIALIFKEHMEEIRVNREDFREAMAQLEEAVHSYRGDELPVREASRALCAIGEEMAVHRAKLNAALKGVLTPEQLQSLEQHRAAMLERKTDQHHLGRSFLDEWIEIYSK